MAIDERLLDVLRFAYLQEVKAAVFYEQLAARTPEPLVSEKLTGYDHMVVIMSQSHIVTSHNCCCPPEATLHDCIIERPIGSPVPSTEKVESILSGETGNKALVFRRDINFLWHSFFEAFDGHLNDLLGSGKGIPVFVINKSCSGKLSFGRCGDDFRMKASGNIHHCGDNTLHINHHEIYRTGNYG